MPTNIPTNREVWVRLETKISEARAALIDSAAAAGLAPEQEAAYKRLVAALDELLARIRANVATAGATEPSGLASPLTEGLEQPEHPR